MNVQSPATDIRRFAVRPEVLHTLDAVTVRPFLGMIRTFFMGEHGKLIHEVGVQGAVLCAKDSRVTLTDPNIITMLESLSSGHINKEQTLVQCDCGPVHLYHYNNGIIIAETSATENLPEWLCLEVTNNPRFDERAWAFSAEDIEDYPYCTKFWRQQLLRYEIQGMADEANACRFLLSAPGWQRKSWRKGINVHIAVTQHPFYYFNRGASVNPDVDTNECIVTVELCALASDLLVKAVTPVTPNATCKDMPNLCSEVVLQASVIVTADDMRSLSV